MSERSAIIDYETESSATHPVSEVNTFARSYREHYTYTYILGLGLLTLLGHIYVLAFPTLAIVSAYSLYSNLHEINMAGTNMTLTLIQLSTLILSSVMSIYLFRHKPMLPAGRPVTVQEAPRLVQLVSEVCSELHISTIHRIRITREFELSLIRTPRSGYPFRSINTLIIGLPMMQCLTPVQFRSAVHRELVHLSGKFSRASRLFYFSRQNWLQYQQTYQSDTSITSLIMRVFFSWYSPLYRFYSRKAARQEEFYTDHQANSNIKDDGLVDMLTAIMLSNRFLEEEFWPSLYNKAYKFNTAPYMPYSCLEIHYRNKLLPRIAQHWIDEALQSKPINATMPDFYTRINMLDVWNVGIPHTSDESAATYFLDEIKDIVIDQMDQIWFKSNRYQWQQKFKKGQLERNKLKELKLQASQGLLSTIKTHEYIQLITKYVERHEAMPLYKKLLEIDHKDAQIYFEIGYAMITSLNADGIHVLEKAMSMDTRYTVRACNLITQYYMQMGNSRFAQPYRRRALAYQVEAA